MAIFLIEGGIGCGKTLTGVWYVIQDLYAGKKIITNTYLKNIPRELRKNVQILDKEMIENLYEKVKDRTLKLPNTTLFLQEAHNYMDSRRSMSKKNQVLTRFITMSRHSGQGSFDIIVDTQKKEQLDIRLRQNTDYLIHPQIIKYELKKSKSGKITKLPHLILLDKWAKIGHKEYKLRQIIDVSKVRDQYDTHELVDF